MLLKRRRYLIQIYMADEGESVEIQADPIAASPLVQEILALLRKSYDHAPY